MVDVLTRAQRSYNMSRIRGRDTQPEFLLRKVLSEAGFRGYRLHPKLVGKPDIVFSKKKVAMFIDGCFWHNCPKCFTKPATNKLFWEKKIGSNVLRDRTVNAELKKQGWHVIRIWEHQVKQQKFIKSKIIDRIGNAKRND